MEGDTPGGTAIGTNQLASVVRASPKPIVGFVDVMAASAGYWVFSQTDHIMMNTREPESSVGSIGTLYMHINAQKMIENEIGEVTIFRAEQSEDKARINQIEPLTEDQKKEIIDDLTRHANIFIESVKDGRGNRLKTGKENVFTGKTYLAEEAIKYGLADSRGTLADAIQRASNLAMNGSYKNFRSQRDNQKSNNQTETENLNKETNMGILSKWLGGNADQNQADENGQVTIEASELQQLRNDMEKANKENENLTNERDQLKDQVTNLQSEKQALETERDQLKDQVSKLENTFDETAGAAEHESDSTQNGKKEDYHKEDRDWNAKANKALGRA